MAHGVEQPAMVAAVWVGRSIAGPLSEDIETHSRACGVRAASRSCVRVVIEAHRAHERCGRASIVQKVLLRVVERLLRLRVRAAQAGFPEARVQLVLHLAHREVGVGGTFEAQSRV
eukprot:3451145-Prymnesium_polylepis.1